MKELHEMSLEELWKLFPIVLKEGNSEYSVWYEEEKATLLHHAADFDICRIHHIGSTAVNGLVAKPIIDILLELPSGYSVDDVAASLEKQGWIVMAKDKFQQTIDLNKGYTPQGFAKKVFHLHIKPLNDWDELYFRDYLKAHHEVALEYASLKKSLKEQFEHNRDAYTAGKTQFIKSNTNKAREEFGLRYLPLSNLR